MEKYKKVVDIKRLIISLNYLEEGLELARSLDYRDIVINTSDCTPAPPFFKKKEIDLGLILKYQFIEKIGISDSLENLFQPLNLTSLSQLKNLKRLELRDNNSYILDLSSFKELKTLIYVDSKSVTNLSKLSKLEELIVYKYQKKDLVEFSSMSRLKELTITETQIESLQGIENCKNLTKLSLFYAKKIISLQGVEDLEKLSLLEIYKAPKLEYLSGLKKCKSLKEFKLEGVKKITNFIGLLPELLDFIYLDVIDNLDFINELKKLDSIAFNNLLSNDLLPILNHETLRMAAFTSKKSYNYTEKQIQKLLDERNLR